VVFALRTPLARRLARAAEPGRVRRLLVRVVAGMPARWGALAADLALALTSWSSKLAAFALLIRAALAAAGVASPSLALLAAAAVAGDTAGALPLPTLGGVGPFEAGIVLGLTALGIDGARALAIGVLLHGALLATIVGTGAIALAVGLVLERRAA
jgi:uncharacterized membrane protein YbhN (UPF0104 family)